MAIRKRILLPLVGGGLALGAAAAWLLSDQYARSAEQLIAAFDRYCLADLLGNEPADPQKDGFLLLRGWSDGAWVEPTTGLVIIPDSSPCTVSMISPLTISDYQVAILGESMSQRAKQLGLPDVEGPEKTGLPVWAYMEGPRQSAERWGISFAHSRRVFAEHHTTLHYYFPPATPPPNALLSTD